MSLAHGATSRGTSDVLTARDRSIDALKGLAIVMVLVLHIGPVRFAQPGQWMVAGPGRGVVGGALATMLAIVYREVLQYAVPVFLLVSLSLYVSRAAVRPGYFWKRALRLVELLVFWLGVQVLLSAIVNGGWPALSWHALRIGGPSLQSGGAPGTVLYFLVNLIVLVALAEVALALAQTLGARGREIVGSALVAVPLVWFVLAPAFGVRLEYWDLANFVPYVGVALLLGGDLHALVPKRFALLIAAGVLLTAEVATVAFRPEVTYDALPDYARVSIVVGSLALVAWALRYLPQGRALVFLGEYSLGVFTLHALVQAGVLHFMPSWWLSGSLGTVQVNVASGIVVVALTLAAVGLLSLTPLKRFVR